MVHTRDVLRRDGQHELLVYIEGAFLSNQFSEVIETMEAKLIDCMCLPVYDVDKATNAMVDECCILVYAVRKPCDDLLKIFIPIQVITLLASTIHFYDTAARV